MKEERYTREQLNRMSRKSWRSEKSLAALKFWGTGYLPFTIQEEIDVLENGQTTYANIQKLSWLYTVRAFSKGATTSKIDPVSDFLVACRGKDANALFDVLNDHMDAIRILCPKEYEAVIRRIKRL